MIVLNKKKITLVLLGAFLSIFVFILATDKNEMVPTVSLPVSGKKIVIDAEHGKPDEGVSLLH